LVRGQSAVKVQLNCVCRAPGGWPTEMTNQYKTL
jgi:hypothetical protein